MNETDLERLADFSDRVRESTVKRLMLVPQGKENIGFPLGSMSPADIAAHLAQIDVGLKDLTETRFKAKDLGISGQRIVTSRTEYDDLIADLVDLKFWRRQFILGLTEESLLLSIKLDSLSGPSEMDLGSMIYRLLDHECHHRGTVAVYLRAYEKGF